MHVAIFSGSLARGGTERVVANLIDYLIDQGDTVTLVNQCKSEIEYPLNPSVPRYIIELTEEEYRECQACKTPIGRRFKNFNTRYKKVDSIWKERKPDVILSFISKQNFMSIITADKRKIPVLVSVRALPELEYPGRTMKLAANLLYRKASKVIFQTKDQSKFFSKTVQKKGIILRNPLNPEFMAEPYEGEREHTIVSVGRIDENKNHKLLIDAFMNIAKDFPDWKVQIYGDGELRENLQKYAIEGGFGEQIQLLGNTNNVSEQIRKAGVFVLTSDTEGSPNSLIEAMCLGLPCISTDCPCGGPGELITDGVNGLLIPVGDLAKMQDSLQNLLNNIQKRDEIGRNSMDTRAIFEPTTVLKQWRDELVKACEQ